MRVNDMETRAVPTEASVREDLAAVYRLCHRMNLNEGVCNHLTALVPGTRDRFLVIRYGMLWSEVSADNLVLIDAHGSILAGHGPVETTAFEIHRAIHLTDPEKYSCVLHTHMPYATALCCIMADQPGLRMCHQNSLKFFDDWAYDPVYSGLVLSGDEGQRLARALCGKRVLLHRNHGVIVCGASVAEAFDDLYYLERAAQAQVLAMSTGSPLCIVPDGVARETKRMEDMEKPASARLHLDAWKREIARDDGSARRGAAPPRDVLPQSLVAAIAAGALAGATLMMACRGRLQAR